MVDRKKRTLPTGIDDFREIRERNKYYVDKTLILSEFIALDEKVTLITRPRRFGKTLNMTTLRDFFDITQDSRAIFEGLSIMQTEYAAEINSRPTVYLTFKGCSGVDLEELKESLCHVLKEAYFKYDKILAEAVDWESSDYYEFRQNVESFKRLDEENPEGGKYAISNNRVKRSLLVLVQTLAKYYNQPVLLLIDEYDQPLLEAHNRNFRKEFSEDIYGPFLGNALKGNEKLGQSMLTGIQRIAKESIFSKLNNISVYTVMKKRYAPYFGLTEAETTQVLEDNGLRLSDDVKFYYDGYNFGGIEIYNPWSVLNYVSEQEIAPFWINTSTNLLIRQLILKADVDFKEDFEKLILNGMVEISANIEASFMELDTPATLWGLLINAGYITVVETISSKTFTVRIPNHEVKDEFRSIVELYTQTRADQLSPLFEALFNKNMPRFLTLYRKLILNHVSYHDTLNENSFHMLFLGMSIATSGMYRIKSNREMRAGRSDIVMHSLQPAERPHLIIELKHGEDLKKEAAEALNQILENKYYAELTGEVICVGVAHYQKKCELLHQIIDVDEDGEWLPKEK